MRLPAQRAAALLAIAGALACTRARENAADAPVEAAPARVESDAATADERDAPPSEGDACEPPDQIACAPDAARELRCVAGRWAVVRVCHARCVVRGDDLFCD